MAFPGLFSSGADSRFRVGGAELFSSGVESRPKGAKICSALLNKFLPLGHDTQEGGQNIIAKKDQFLRLPPMPSTHDNFFSVAETS